MCLTYDTITVDQGFRALRPEITFAGHEFDEVLGLYFAKARMYDQGSKRFTAVDPVKGSVAQPLTLVQYLYVLDNPETRIDLLGLQYVIISGGKYGTEDGYNYEFIDSALLQIKILREVDKTKESILWLVANSGWNQGQKNDIKTAAYHWKDVDVRFFSKSSSMIDFMNKGVSNNRKDDLISGVFVFSHGFPGTISFGYHQDNEADLTFAAEQIKKLNQGIFKSNAYFVLYTCRAGSTKDGATNFAQTLADWTGRDVTATYSDKHTEGRTDYGNIMGLSFKEYLKLSAIEVSPKKIKELADIYNDSLEYEQKRKDAVGGIEKPYPAFQLPEPSGNPLTELDPHWVIYTPTK